MEGLPDDRTTVARRATFRLDYGQPTVQGWTQCANWNGWGCPCFEHDVATHVAALLNAQAADGDDHVIIAFDEENDTYVIRDPDDPGEQARVPGRDIQTTAGTKHVYALGAYEWCWHEQGVHFDT